MRNHPWRLFLAALAGSALVVVGFVAAVDRASAAQQPPPTLRSITPAALASSGITLRAPEQAPYCGLQQAAAGRGWLPAGSAGCAIGRDAAVAADAHTHLAGAQVVETLLARVTSTTVRPTLKDRLVWLVVSRDRWLPAVAPGMAAAVSARAMACLVLPLPSGGGPPYAVGCPGPITSKALQRLTLVDGLTGQVLATLYPGMRPYQGVVPGVGLDLGRLRPGAVPTPSARPTPKLVPPVGG